LEITLKELTGIAIFFVKSAIVSLLFFLVATMLLPNFKDIRAEWKEFTSKRENQALVFSFVQNPVALTLAGERDFKQKNFVDAALKFELAIGLLEMHGASPATIRPYQVRFEEANKLASLQITK
jgi:hypothetical protein